MTVEDKINEHLEGFPLRQKEMLERFDRLENQIKQGLSHPEPSAKTIAMIGLVKDEMDEVKKLNQHWTIENDRRHRENTEKLERITRVLFGEPLNKEDNGIQGMVKDIHTEFVQKKGLISAAKLFLLFGGVTAMIYALFKKF